MADGNKLWINLSEHDETNNTEKWQIGTSRVWELIDEKELILRLFGSVICGLVILVTLSGNVLVTIVVSRFRRLRNVTNVLLASLATADITVAILVMPLLVVYDFERQWRFGPIACHLWISCDVMCCTASILHLCVIALDRFWAITRPFRYQSLVSKKRVGMVILGIWVCSAAISFIPIFLGWYSDGTSSLFDEIVDCSLKVNRIYAIVSSMTSFYLPLPVMFYVYFRILMVAEKQSREIKQLELSLHGADHRIRRSIRQRSRQLITDTKAIRTLGIVMGVFCVCWLPFFLMYVILAYCPDCDLSYEVRSGLTWLGYFNSAFNPCIYAYTNKDFKDAFRQALCCRRDYDRDFKKSEDGNLPPNSRGGIQKMERIQTGVLNSDFHIPTTPTVVECTSWTTSPIK